MHLHTADISAIIRYEQPHADTHTGNVLHIADRLLSASGVKDVCVCVCLLRLFTGIHA